MEQTFRRVAEVIILSLLLGCAGHLNVQAPPRVKVPELKALSPSDPNAWACFSREDSEEILWLVNSLNTYENACEAMVREVNK